MTGNHIAVTDRNDLYCVGWGVKLYSIQSMLTSTIVTGMMIDCWMWLNWLSCAPRHGAQMSIKK